jgi:pilus assembly protein CpaF
MDRAAIYGATLRHFFAPVADLLYDDESVTEVLINGPGDIYCERGGRLEKVDRRFPDEQSLDAAVQNLAEYVHRRLDDEHHSMDARLPAPEKFRVHVLTPACSRQGTCVSIRKFRRATTTLDWLVQRNSLSAEAAEYLTVMVRAHRNLIVSGGTGTGKTSLLNALSTIIPEHERILVIEDSSELQLSQPHTVYMEAKQAKPNGKGGVTIRDLFVDSLRMRPDRILVGEVRRGEALDLVQSMLSGHDGSMSTVHASSPLLALVRLETLCLMNDMHMPVYVARTQVASAVHVIVQLRRMPDGSRGVSAIHEVSGLNAKEKYRMRPIFDTAHGSEKPTLAWSGRASRFAAEVTSSGQAREARLTRKLWQVAEKPAA